MSKILSEQDIVKMSKQFGSEEDYYLKMMEASDIGAPMFEKNDLIGVKGIIDKLLRYLFIKKRISISKFKLAVFSYCKYLGIGHPSYVGSSENTEYTNIKRTITTDCSKFGLTFTNFRKVVSNILGYQIEDISIKLRHVGTKEIINLSLMEIDGYLKSNDYNYPDKKLKEDNFEKEI